MIKKVVVGILSLSLILFYSSCNIKDSKSDITDKPNISLVCFDALYGIGEISYYYKKLENSKVNVSLEIYNKGNLIKKVEIPVDKNYSKGTLGLSIKQIEDSNSIKWMLRHNESFKELTLDNISNIFFSKHTLSADGERTLEDGEEFTLVQFIVHQGRLVDKSEDEIIKDHEFVYFLKLKYEAIGSK